MEKRVVLYSERGLSSVVDGIQRIESAVDSGHGSREDLFPARHRHRQRDCADRVVVVDVAAPHAARHPAALHHSVERVERACRADHDDERDDGRREDLPTTGRTFCACGCSRFPGFRRRRRTAERRARSRSTSIRRSSSARACPRRTSSNAVNNSNVFIPAGTARIGDREYNVAMNSSPSALSEFENIPIKVVNGAPITIGDVATVADGFRRSDEHRARERPPRASYMSILKKADASTLAVVDATKALLPEIRATAPDGLDLRLDFDQSVFVRAAVASVVREGVDRGAARRVDDSDVSRQLAQRARGGASRSRSRLPARSSGSR